MKSKKIIIAALSLGLIFAPTKPLVFAADAELISTDEDRFNEIKQSDMMHYQTMVNTYQNKKDGISEKQIANFSNVNKIYKQLETLSSEKQNYESELEKANQENASDAYKNDIITNIERVDKDIEQKKEEYAEVVRIREDLRINAEGTDAYLVAYKKTLKAVRKSQNLLDLNKAKLKNEIKIIMIEKAITSSEKDTYFEEVDKASTIEELDKIRQEVLKIKDEYDRLKQENEENPETETDNQSPDQNETTAPNEEELKAAKESAIKNLKSKTNLTEAQVKLFEEEINNVENLEELAEINKKVNEADEKAAKAKEVSEAKDNAKQSLESSEHIDSEQKVIFENQIEEADTIDKILEIENNIKLADEKAKKEKIAQELANSKQILEEKLENTILTQDQKDEFEKQIVEATDKETLANIEEEITLAVEVAKKEKIAQELKAAKESAIENLKSKSNLTEDQEKLFEEAISNAENLEELAEINKKVDETEEEASKAKELSEAKDKAKQSLESSEHIDSEQKTDFEKQIEKSETIDHLLDIENNILKAEGSAIRELELKELEENKKILRENLNSKEILTQDQKEEFDKQIAEATDKETLTKIEEEIILAVEVAKKEKEAQELANSKQILEEKLENTNLSSEQKDSFKDRILNAENQADLEAIKKDIDQADEEAAKAKELAEAKEKAKQSLENAKNINLEQKTNFEKQIEDSNTIDQLLEIENNIKLADEKAQQEKIAQELANSKQILEEKLENTNLSPEQKDAFKDRILNAKNQADLETIESDINQADEKAKKEKASQELENAKTALEEKLLATSLSQDQKDSFLEKINKAADLEGLEAIDKEIKIASNQVDENIGNETEKDPSNEETPSIPDPEEEKPIDEEKDPSEENPNEGESGSVPKNQDDNPIENPDPSNEDPVDDDNELENNPQNPDPDNSDTDSSDTSENVENTPTDNSLANGRENNTADGENPEKTSPEGQKPRNTKITRPIFGNTTPVYRPLESTHYLPSTITINETSSAKKDTIELKDDLKYLKKATYKISDLEAKRDKIEAAIKKNKATVRAIGILEDLAPKTLAKNRAKINALLEQSQKLLAQANYALAEYNYLLNK